VYVGLLTLCVFYWTGNVSPMATNVVVVVVVVVSAVLVVIEFSIY